MPMPTTTPSSTLLTSAHALELTESEQATIASLEAATQSASPAEYAQLVEFASDVAVRTHYAALAKQEPDLMREETAWLAATVRGALAETAGQAPWAVLFLTLAWQTVVCRKVEHRLHPTAPVAPSAFVYAMQ